MTDEVIRAADPQAIGWGSSGIIRSKESRNKDWHNKWKRACVDVCWGCFTLTGCCHPCKKAQAVLDKKGITK